MSEEEIAQSAPNILGYWGDYELDGGGLRIFLMSDNPGIVICAQPC